MKIFLSILFFLLSLNLFSQKKELIRGLVVGKSVSTVNIEDYISTDTYFQVQFPIKDYSYLFIQNILKENISDKYDYWEIGILGGYGFDYEFLKSNDKRNVFYMNFLFGYNYNNILYIDKPKSYDQYSMEIGYGFQMYIYDGLYLCFSLRYDNLPLQYETYIESLHLVLNVKSIKK